MADITIKKLKSKKRPIRARKPSNSDEDNNEEDDINFSSKLEEMKTIQKLRERPRGVEISTLDLGEQMKREETKDSDPFKVKSGGMINMKNVTVKNVDDAYDVGIGTQFSAETNKRDEDEEMMKYIEEQLLKRKTAETGQDGTNDNNSKTYHSPEEAALQALPEHLKTSSHTRSEEMLSNQMLNGIPEVDLGIESKIKNIEATEEAKLRLLWEQRNRKEGPSHFVPTNIAVNFTQKPKSMKGFGAEEEKIGDKRGHDSSGKSKSEHERATDDYHYERFKKQFRRF